MQWGFLFVEVLGCMQVERVWEWREALWAGAMAPQPCQVYYRLRRRAPAKPVQLASCSQRRTSA